MVTELSIAAKPQYPVRLAAQRSGVTPHLLRAWERRYRVVSPTRSEGGQRLYSDLDVDRLRLLRQLTEQGHGIGQLAKLALPELERMAQEEPAASFNRGSVERVGEFRSAAIRAAECLAARELQGVLERATVSLGVPVFLEQVASPSIQEIGQRWSEGTISVGQEHLATVVFRRVLGWIIDTFEVSDATARLVVGTPSGQAHELGALMAAAAAAVEGWDIIYLGADLPADEIIKGVKQTGARAVALSIVRPTADPALFEQLRSVRQGVGRDVEFFLGGAAVAQDSERFRTTGAKVFDSLDEFRAVLRGMVKQGS